MYFERRIRCCREDPGVPNPNSSHQNCQESLVDLLSLPARRDLLKKVEVEDLEKGLREKDRT